MDQSRNRACALPLQEEPYAEEAYLFMRQLALQRSVEFDVETVDR